MWMIAQICCTPDFHCNTVLQRKNRLFQAKREPGANGGLCNVLIAFGISLNVGFWENSAMTRRSRSKSKRRGAVCGSSIPPTSTVLPVAMAPSYHLEVGSASGNLAPLNIKIVGQNATSGGCCTYGAPGGNIILTPGAAAGSYNAGGVAIGTYNSASANGLAVSGSVGIRTPSPNGTLDVYGGHLLASRGETAPTISSCGTSPTISGTDNSFKVTMGSGVLTSCVINFGTT